MTAYVFQFLFLWFGVGHCLFGVLHTSGSRVSDNTEDRQHSEQSVHNIEELVAKITEINLKAEHSGNDLYQQQHSRDQSQPKGLVFQSYSPVTETTTSTSS